MATIDKSTIQFLKKLSSNNNRDWFQENKSLYEAANENIKSWTNALEAEMNKHDNLEGSKVFRIYRDVRFSKDKSPYKTHFGIFLKRATARLRGGYYLHIEPGNSFIGGGFWQPNADDLKRIREEFARDDKPIRKIIKAATFKKYFGELRGDELKTAPKGFDKEHPAIDLIRKKSYTVQRHFSDAEMLDPSFMKEANKTYRAMRPYFDYMSEVLTTDLNGVSLLDD